MVEQVVPKPETEDVVDEAVAPPWMTILHNCECHTFEQVVKQLQKAIACSEAEGWERSEEHTSELQSRLHLVCRLLLEKKKSAPRMWRGGYKARSAPVARTPGSRPLGATSTCRTF